MVKPRKNRSEHELAMKRVRAATEITTTQVRVHGLEAIGWDEMTREHARTKARREPFDARFDAITEGFGMSRPTARRMRGDP